MNEPFLVHLDSGSKKLLEIATTNDKANMLFNNKALSNGLHALAILHSFCVNEKIQKIIDWLKLPDQKEKTFFLQLTAAFLKAIQSSEPRGIRMEISDYDHYVLMATAETLSEVMWQDKKVNDIPGPDLKICMEVYGMQELNIILQVFIKNYIGNVLQHLFEAAKIRFANPKLSPDTEIQLKEREAVLVSNFIFNDFSSAANDELRTKKIIHKLNSAQKLILEKL